MRTPALLLAAAALACVAACTNDDMQNSPRPELATAPVGTSNSPSSGSSSNAASGSTVRSQESQPNVPSQTR